MSRRYPGVRCDIPIAAYQFMFRHELLGATWRKEEGKWDLKLKSLETGKVFIDTCDFYASATSILNKWKWPDIESREGYKGRIVHSANLGSRALT
ncbi:hypothetical protein BDV12DRAFT_204517 [Aspergillus spectabilis]